MNSRLKSSGLLIAVALFMTMEPSSAQEGGGTLEEAIRLFEDGDWEESAPHFETLLLPAETELTGQEKKVIRKYLAWIHMLNDDPQGAKAVLKAAISSDASFFLSDLSLPDEEPTMDMKMVFAQAVLEVRQEEVERRMAVLERASHAQAFFRSALLPGLGQRYQGYKGKSLAVLGLAAGSVVYAVVADRAYRNARDDYRNASAGTDRAEFDQLYTEFSDKSTTADFALGIVAAAWGINLLDVLVSGPNLAGLHHATVQVQPRRGGGGTQLALVKRF